MAQRPKDIGTKAETMVVKYAQVTGFPKAERLALKGKHDQGDVRLTYRVNVEVKAGHAAENASEGQIGQWMEETEREIQAGHCHFGFLIRKRKGKGQVGDWWAHIDTGYLFDLIRRHRFPSTTTGHEVPNRIYACLTVKDMFYLLDQAKWTEQA